MISNFDRATVGPLFLDCDKASLIFGQSFLDCDKVALTGQSFL